MKRLKVKVKGLDDTHEGLDGFKGPMGIYYEIHGHVEVARVLLEKFLSGHGDHMAEVIKGLVNGFKKAVQDISRLVPKERIESPSEIVTAIQAIINSIPPTISGISDPLDMSSLISSVTSLIQDILQAKHNLDDVMELYTNLPNKLSPSECSFALQEWIMKNKQGVENRWIWR